MLTLTLKREEQSKCPQSVGSMLKMVHTMVQEHTHNVIRLICKLCKIIILNTNDLHSYLHIEWGRELQSQVVTGDTFRKPFNARCEQTNLALRIGSLRMNVNTRSEQGQCLTEIKPFPQTKLGQIITGLKLPTTSAEPSASLSCPSCPTS